MTITREATPKWLTTDPRTLGFQVAGEALLSSANSGPVADATEAHPMRDTLHDWWVSNVPVGELKIPRPVYGILEN